jgi:hypothetical protein
MRSKTSSFDILMLTDNVIRIAAAVYAILLANATTRNAFSGWQGWTCKPVR